MFEQDFALEDIILIVALGHGLSETKSAFALLSKDVMQNILVPEIEKSFWKSRAKIGLLTPTGTSTSRCHLIDSSESSAGQQFRRETLISPSLPRLGVVPFSLCLNKEIRISGFLASRYAELVHDMDEDDRNLRPAPVLLID